MKKWNMTRCVFSLAAAMLTLIAGGAASAADTPASFPKENVTIEIWWHEYGPFTAYVKELIGRTRRCDPNVTINPVVTSSGDINQKLTVGSGHRHGSRHHGPGCFVLRAYYAKGVLEPLNLERVRRQELRGNRRAAIRRAASRPARSTARSMPCRTRATR